MQKSLKINIKESPRKLKELLHQQQKGRYKERIQVLYLLATQQAKTALAAARLVGRAYSTVKKWLKTYHQKGINGLLEMKSGGDRRSCLPLEVLEALEARLQQPRGFFIPTTDQTNPYIK